MRKKIAVTGQPGCGKTTLCSRLAERFENKVGGLLTEEIREGKKRVGFKLKDLTTGKEGLLSHVEKCSGSKIGKYSICQDQLQSLAPEAIERSLTNKELLIVDEIGPMELKSERFIEAIDKALQSDTNCLFTIHYRAIHYRARHPLLVKIRDKLPVMKLTKDNRDEVLKNLVSHFLEVEQ